MDNEDFGRNNPRFKRYIPPCYRNHQKYIPSMYLKEKDGLPDKETVEFCTTQVIDNITYRVVKNKSRKQVQKASDKKKPVIIS